MAFRNGDIVVFTNPDRHLVEPRFYPEAGTIGKIVSVSGVDACVQWPPGTTKSDGRWFTGLGDICLFTGSQSVQASAELDSFFDEFTEV